MDRHRCDDGLSRFFALLRLPSSRLDQRRIEIVRSVSPRHFQPGLEPLENETLRADRKLRLGHFAEQPRRLVDAIFADVDVLFGGAYRPPLAERVQVHDPTVRDDELDGHRLVQRHPHHFVRKESGKHEFISALAKRSHLLSGRLVVRLVRSQVVMTVSETLSRLRVLPQSLDPEYV
jgi:hypothetical protein